jgi:hypothetical protein
LPTPNDIDIHNMQQAHIAARAKQHGVRSLPRSLSTANLPDAAPSQNRMLRARQFVIPPVGASVLTA